MSKLLIQEEPLQVLPGLAVLIGLNEAIILQQLHYWLQRSERVIDGRKWIYNSYEAWRKQFPFWGLNTIKRAMTTLEKRGLVESTTQHNQQQFDHTKWYTINYEAVDNLGGNPSQHGCTPSTHNGSTVDPQWADDRPNLPSLPEITSEITPEIKIPPNTPSGYFPPQGNTRPVLVKALVKHVASKRCPADYSPSPELRAQCETKWPDICFDDELAAMKDYEFATAHVDWDATLRTWIRTAAKRLSRYRKPMPPVRSLDEQVAALEASLAKEMRHGRA